MITMTFYITETKDGLIHVQNMVMGYAGQHHVHTPKGYQEWLKGISERERKTIKIRKVNECQCGLQPSEVREYDGQKWVNNRF